MTIEPFRPADIEPFLELAQKEGWVAEPWEFAFLLTTFPQGSFTARDDGGNCIGYITTIRHGESGWVGNLIVAEPFRGRGIGEALFTKAIEALRSAGAGTIWLTASRSGAPLYEKYGFRTVDEIHRWSRNGSQRRPAHDAPTIHCELTSASLDLDSRTWGDRRAKLLETTTGRGTLLQNSSGFIVRQPCGNAFHIGPFAAENSSTAALLFDTVRGATPRGSRIFIDAPASNRSAHRLYTRRKMRVTGSNQLMYSGEEPDFRPELLYGLATMGSCG